MTRRQLLASIDSAELTEWMAFYSIEPTVEDRIDHGFAMLASVLCNLKRRKGQKPFTPEQFMPKWDRLHPSENELEAKLLALAWGLGAEDKRGKRGKSR